MSLEQTRKRWHLVDSKTSFNSARPSDKTVFGRGISRRNTQSDHRMCAWSTCVDVLEGAGTRREDTARHVSQEVAESKGQKMENVRRTSLASRAVTNSRNRECQDIKPN